MALVETQRGIVSVKELKNKRGTPEGTYIDQRRDAGRSENTRRTARTCTTLG